MPLTRVPGGVFRLGAVPRVGFELANAEADFLFVPVDAEHDGFDLLTGREHVARFGDALGPGQFGDMDEAFDAGFEFHKRAVGHEVDDLALDLRADREFAFDAGPGILHLLLEAEADAFLVLVHVEHHDVNVLADLEHFRRMADAAPAHVGDVQQTVNAVEVNERAEVGDVLDRALANVARHHFGQQLLAALGAFGFDEFAAGEDDVLPLLVDLDDLEIVGVADELREVLGRDDVNLRRGQEGLDADVDDQTALDDGLDPAGDAAAFVANRENLVPVLLELGLLLGENDHAFLVFELLDQDVHDVADLDGLDVVELVAGDDPFTLVADVHEHFLVADFDNGTFDNFIGGKADGGGALLQGFFHREHNFPVN